MLAAIIGLAKHAMEIIQVIRLLRAKCVKSGAKVIQDPQSVYLHYLSLCT